MPASANLLASKVKPLTAIDASQAINVHYSLLWIKM